MRKFQLCRLFTSFIMILSNKDSFDYKKVRTTKMKIVEVYGCKYQVMFEHPDYGCEFHEFIVDDDNAPSPFADEELWVEYHKEIAKNVWKTFNASGFYHTMTITAEIVVDGKVYNPTICEEFSWSDVL